MALDRADGEVGDVLVGERVNNFNLARKVAKACSEDDSHTRAHLRMFLYPRSRFAYLLHVSLNVCHCFMV